MPNLTVAYSIRLRVRLGTRPSSLGRVVQLHRPPPP